MVMHDILNLLIIICVILIAFGFKIIPLWLGLIQILYAFAPFLLNDFIFPTSFMSDQFRYIDHVKAIRSFDWDYVDGSGTVELASWMMAMIPLPYVETVYSLGFFNRLIATILTIWLYSFIKIRGLAFSLYLLYPSFIIYSSLALRDTLILFFMITSLVYFIKGKRFFSLIFLSPLFFLKFQNFYLILIIYTIQKIFDNKSIIFKYKYIIYSSLLALLFINGDQLIERIDFYRLAMFYDNGGARSEYTNINNFYDLLKVGFFSSFYFLIKPLIWEATNFFQLALSIESFGLLFFLIIFFFQIYKKNNIICLKWIFSLFVCMFVYGLVVSNFGTSGRYKFPIILFVVTGAALEYMVKKNAMKIYNIGGFKYEVQQR
jgi:hypothetical protein